jgi:hypothetical protein
MPLLRCNLCRRQILFHFRQGVGEAGRLGKIMNHAKTIIVGSLAVWGTTCSSHSGDVVVTNQPYDAIVARNIFGLLPPVPPAVDVPQGEPLVKITITGLMSIFGQFQVLFKSSSPGKAGQPAKDNYYVLKQQQSEDGIEVLHINGETGVVTFNNHGAIQEIALAGWSGTNSALPVVSESSDAPAPAANLPKVYPESFTRARTPDYLGGGPDGVGPGQPLPATSMEDRILLIEAQRAYLKSHHDPAADLLPPTALTPPDAP